MYKRTGKLLTRKYREYLLPTIMSSVSVLLASFIDGIIVGNLIDDKALSAVNLNSPLVMLFQALFFLFGIGGSTAVLISKGRKDSKKANTIFSLSLVSALVVAVLITVFGVIFIDPLSKLFCQSDDSELLALVKEYALVLISGTFFMVMVPFLVYFIRADGKPRLSANILLVANVINLIMDFVYIGVFKMGVGGAAFATLTGYVIGFIIELTYIFSKKRTIKFARLKLSDFKYLGEICSGSIASTVNTVLLGTKSLLLNQIVLSVGGADGIAVFTVCNFSSTFISMFILGGSEAMVPIVGMLYGEKDSNGISFVVKRAFSVVMFFCGISVAIIEIAPQLLLNLFQVSSASQLEIGVPAVRIFAFSLIAMSFSLVLMNFFQVTKKKNLALTITILRGFVLIISLAYAFAQLFGISGLWWAFVAAEFLTVAIVLVICIIIHVHSKGRYVGFFLNEAHQGEKVFDVTVRSNNLNAVNISQVLIEFCRENNLNQNTSNIIGVAVEEALVNIMNYNDKNEVETDVICRITDTQVLLSLRDNGKPLNPTIFDAENQEQFTNTQLILSIASSVNHANTLGLNNTVIAVNL